MQESKFAWIVSKLQISSSGPTVGNAVVRQIQLEYAFEWLQMSPNVCLSVLQFNANFCCFWLIQWQNRCKLNANLLQ